MAIAPTSAGRVLPAGPIPAAWREPRSGPWTTVPDVVIALAFFFLSLIGRPEVESGITQGGQRRRSTSSCWESAPWPWW